MLLWNMLRERKKLQKYEFRYEIASERNKIAGYTLIPKSDRTIESLHLSEHELFQEIHRLAFKGESEEVQKLLLGLSEFKRKDLKSMLIKSAVTLGKTLTL